MKSITPPHPISFFFKSLVLKRYIAIFLLMFSFIACKKDLDVSKQSDFNNYYGRESTLSQYEIEGWLEAQYDTLKPHTCEMIDKILENADFPNMYVDSLDEDRNVVVVPIRTDYFSQHIPSESTPLQYLVLIEDENGDILKGNLFLYFPEDPMYEEIPAGGIRDFYKNAQIFLDQPGKLKVVTLSDLKLGEFEYEGGVLHTSTVLTSEWDEEGSIENERRCQDWHIVRYYFDLVTFEILGSDVIAEGNTCDNECPPYEPFCDEEFGGGTGLEQETPTPRSVIQDVDIIIKQGEVKVTAVYTLLGNSFRTSSMNVFTADPALDFTLIFHINPSGSVSTHPLYSTWTTILNEVGRTNANKSANIRVGGNLAYPVRNETEFHVMPRAWNASIVF